MTDSCVFLHQLSILEKRILDNSGDDFPAVVSESFKGLPPLDFRGMDTLLECLPLCRDVPQYYSPGGFGKFNLTLVNNGRFFIMAMFMDDMCTEIHDHPFWGVFLPLQGSPYQLTFDFESVPSVQGHSFEPGKLTISSSRIIPEGTPVKLDKDCIHQLIRVEKNHFSLLVAQVLPQDERQNYFYLYPDLKIGNRPNNGHVARLINAFLTVGQDSILNAMEKLGEEELLELYLRTGSQVAQVQMVSEEIKTIRDCAAIFLKKNSLLWESIQKHEKFMKNIRNKCSIGI